MTDYYDDETWREKAKLQSTAPETYDWADVAEHRSQAYELGVAEGRRLEREEWMKKIGDAVIEALREATGPGDW